MSLRRGSMVVLMLVSVISIAGCTFVRMAPGAAKVRVVERAPSGCVRRGEIDVSVRDSLPFHERNPLRVRDELEVLARNEAPGLGADTVQPEGPPVAEAQRFIAWRCRR